MFKINFTRVNQKFCNILVTRGTVWFLRMLLRKSWRRRTTLDCEILSSHDNPRILLAGFASIRWDAASESTGFGCFCAIMAPLELVILRCTFLCVSFKSHTELSISQSVNAPATTILPTSAGTLHVKYAPQSSMYQNIAKPMTHPSWSQHMRDGCPRGVMVKA